VKELDVWHVFIREGLSSSDWTVCVIRAQGPNFKKSLGLLSSSHRQYTTEQYSIFYSEIICQITSAVFGTHIVEAVFDTLEKMQCFILHLSDGATVFYAALQGGW